MAVIRRVLLVFLVGIVFIISSSAFYPAHLKVNRVIDGDTVVLTDGRRLRYIGIDTPELRHPNKKVREMAEIAKQVNNKLVKGKELTLEYDVEKKDKYGRLLAYVYLKDGTFVNAELLKEGCALMMTIPPNVRHSDLFRKLQKEARESKCGLWSDEYAECRKNKGRARR